MNTKPIRIASKEDLSIFNQNSDCKKVILDCKNLTAKEINEIARTVVDCGVKIEIVNINTRTARELYLIEVERKRKEKK